MTRVGTLYKINDFEFGLVLSQSNDWGFADSDGDWLLVLLPDGTKRVYTIGSICF